MEKKSFRKGFHLKRFREQPLAIRKRKYYGSTFSLRQEYRCAIRGFKIILVHSSIQFTVQNECFSWKTNFRQLGQLWAATQVF